MYTILFGQFGKTEVIPNNCTTHAGAIQICQAHWKEQFTMVDAEQNLTLKFTEIAPDIFHCSFPKEDDQPSYTIIKDPPRPQNIYVILQEDEDENSMQWPLSYESLQKAQGSVEYDWELDHELGGAGKITWSKADSYSRWSTQVEIPEGGLRQYIITKTEVQY